MKKIILCSLTTFLAFTFTPNEIKATTNFHQTELQVNATTLHEIKTTSVLSSSGNEKKSLHNKIQMMEKNHVGPGGIYISVGALIIIILLLIIFL